MLVMPSKLWRFEWSGGGTVKEKIEGKKVSVLMKGCLHFYCTYTITLKNQVVWTMSEIVEWSSGIV